MVTVTAPQKDLKLDHYREIAKKLGIKLDDKLDLDYIQAHIIVELMKHITDLKNRMTSLESTMSRIRVRMGLK